MTSFMKILVEWKVWMAFPENFGVGDEFRADRKSKRAIISSSNTHEWHFGPTEEEHLGSFNICVPLSCFLTFLG
jgi:hypothetical protein